jgi:hypothetical protein
MGALLLCVILAGAGAQTPPPVAMVLKTDGKAMVQRSGKQPERLWRSALLRPGDIVRTGDEGSALLIFLADGHYEQLLSSVQTTIATAGCQPAGVSVRVAGRKLSGANLQSLRELAHSARVGVGELRGDTPAEPQRVTPLYGSAIETDRPSLTWPSDSNGPFLVQLYGGGEGKNRRLLWKKTATETKLRYPEKEKPLQPGRLYHWRVTTSGGEKQTLVNSKFSVLTTEEMAALAAAKDLTGSTATTDWLLAAALFEAHGVYDQALRLYERLTQQLPEEAPLQLILANYYDRAGRPDLARQARLRAGVTESDAQEP